MAARKREAGCASPGVILTDESEIMDTVQATVPGQACRKDETTGDLTGRTEEKEQSKDGAVLDMEVPDPPVARYHRAGWSR